MFHLEEKTLNFFIFVRFHHVVEGFRIPHKVLGHNPLKIEKIKILSYPKRLTVGLFFIYNAKLQGFTLERGVTHAENLPA